MREASPRRVAASSMRWATSAGDSTTVVLTSMTPMPRRKRSIELTQALEVTVAGPSELEHDMVGMEALEEAEQLRPRPRLHPLSAVVAEAEVHGGGAGHGVEDAVDGLGRELGVLGTAGEVGLVHLHDRRVDGAHLLGEHVGERQGEGAQVAVVGVEQHPRQHVGRSVRVPAETETPRTRLLLPRLPPPPEPRRAYSR